MSRFLGEVKKDFLLLSRYIFNKNSLSITSSSHLPIFPHPIFPERSKKPRTPCYHRKQGKEKVITESKTNRKTPKADLSSISGTASNPESNPEVNRFQPPHRRIARKASNNGRVIEFLYQIYSSLTRASRLASLRSNRRSRRALFLARLASISSLRARSR